MTTRAATVAGHPALCLVMWTPCAAFPVWNPCCAARLHIFAHAMRNRLYLLTGSTLHRPECAQVHYEILMQDDECRIRAIGAAAAPPLTPVELKNANSNRALFRFSIERDSNDHAGVLKTRCQETSQQESLPELGAILGRGSFGKVFKGAHFPSHICP